MILVLDEGRTIHAELVVKAIRHVLCATDLASTSRVVDTAATLAMSAGAMLTIMHVLPMPVVPPGQDLNADTMQRLKNRARSRALKSLQALSARTRRAGIQTAVLLRDGEAADQIMRVARATDSDLVVMGTQSRRGLARLLFGSVARRVVGRAPCAVVTVPGRRPRVAARAR